MHQVTIGLPDDLHVHFRDGDLLVETVPATARCFRRAIAMPNLIPPVATAAAAAAYRQRILAARPRHSQFEPLMTLYLTNDTSADDISAAKASGVIAGKLYPAGATTNSESAVSAVEPLYPVFEVMANAGMLLLVHGEVTDPEVDIFDRESMFIDQYLAPLIATFPQLKVVFEHITTREAVAFVAQSPAQVAATITPQHLLLNRNDLLAGGIRPHNYCLPVLKRRSHQEALRQAVAGGSRKFFLGTDSAPHPRDRKETGCGCAGCYSAWNALELYAQVFDELGVLDKLDGFASHYGADFYGLPRNMGSVTLVRESWQTPPQIDLSNGSALVPFMAGETLRWRIKEVEGVEQ